MKKVNKRLNLDKSTIAHLGSARFGQVNGGGLPPISAGASNCDCYTLGRNCLPETAIASCNCPW